MPPLQDIQQVRMASSQLYRGDAREPIGQVLTRLANTGRDVIRQQRVRWMENRSYFRGDQWLQVNASANQVRTVSNTSGRNRRDMDTFNRLRQFTEGRVALLTGESPSFEVQPPNQDQDSIEAARQATKFVKAMWGREGWNIQSIIRELGIDGEIDGIVFLCVEWDQYSGTRTRQPYIRPEGQGFIQTLPPDMQQKALAKGGMILDRSVLEALKEQDPEGRMLWEDRIERLGDVRFRVVRPGALSIDPFATKPHEPQWIVESSIHSRSEIESMAGRKIEAIIKDQEIVKFGREMGNSITSNNMPDNVVDDGDTQQRTLPGHESVMCHRAFHLPCKDFPRGAHVYWLDLAPNAPIVMEPYDDDELPYMAYCPKPDGGHFLRARATVDDLKPMQKALNRRLTQLSRYLDRVANPPLAMPRGSMHSENVYNENGYFEYHAGYQQPVFMQVPAEPTAIISNHLQWIEQQMAEVAVQSGPSRGQAPGQGVDAAVGINLLIQQTEQQLSGTEANLKAVIEWGVSRALRLAGRHYTASRMVAMPGVDNTVEVAAFNAEMLGGAHRFRIMGRMTPRSKAEQWQAMIQFIPLLGPDARPYISQFIEGSIDEFRQNEEGQRARQKREIRQILAVVNNPTAKKVWDDFQAELQMYAQAVQIAQQRTAAMSQGIPPMPGAPPPATPATSPMELLKVQGIAEPNYTEMLRQAGLTVPTVEEYDNHAQHIMVLDSACISDGHDYAPPLQRQLEREHRMSHLNKIGIQAASMGAQMPEQAQEGSKPNPKGTPSPPKNDQGNGGGGTPPQLSRMPTPGGTSAG